jgi:hypothetical protein
MKFEEGSKSNLEDFEDPDAVQPNSLTTLVNTAIAGSYIYSEIVGRLSHESSIGRLGRFGVGVISCAALVLCAQTATRPDKDN